MQGATYSAKALKSIHKITKCIPVKVIYSNSKKGRKGGFHPLLQSTSGNLRKIQIKIP